MGVMEPAFQLMFVLFISFQILSVEFQLSSFFLSSVEEMLLVMGVTRILAITLHVVCQLSA